ncbi:lytic transglycosylase domain-containing protein [Sphingomonas sanxanigenens]|uniref:Transglycosylase SLT domain-containing protein n=1 Tax=Sphingomonas sanxanigenens DSM 19645 = NX02 TaxID=1123269 RepID=W0ACN1_9SPHN|nr:lytic transglycosylase domain-containing protein [Sphingomonas sanxanigenens]AHE54846.1 hypothetical protein NX02_15830 [Sphingomonas sanxanigenens DSM 19645 = NX02]
MAKEKDAKSYFIDCPVDTNIRVANAKASERYAALRGCTANIVHVAPTPLPPDPSVARIQGVSDDDDKPGKGQRKRRRGDTTSAVDGAIDNGAGGRRKVASFAAAPQRITMPPAALRVPATPYDAEIFRTAATYRVDPLFLHAIIATESAHNPNAQSHVGARGLMQIMPATGQTLGVQTTALFDPAINVDAGARLLKRLQRRYGRNFDLILSAYNAGEGAVARYGNRIPPYPETQAYVKKVMARYHGYRRAGTAK